MEQMFLTGFVDGWMAEELQWRLKNSSKKRIDLYISSYGGSVNKGFEMANTIQALNSSNSKDIHTHILSHADSIATVIFLSAPKEKRHIVENSTMFIHEPRALVFDEVTQGDADKLSEELEIQKNRIADFYVKNIEGLEKNEAIELMEGERTLTASKMEEYGIVSEVLPNFNMAANRGNIIANFNKNTVNMFGKKDKPTQLVALNDGSSLLYQGELKEGTELTKVGEIANLKGEHLTNDNRKIVVDENNKVLSIEEVQNNAGGESEIINVVTDMLADMEKRMMDSFEAKLQNIRKDTGGKQFVPKVNNSSSGEFKEGTQSSASANIRKEMQDKYEARRKERGIN